MTKHQVYLNIVVNKQQNHFCSFIVYNRQDVDSLIKAYRRLIVLRCMFPSFRNYF